MPLAPSEQIHFSFCFVLHCRFVKSRSMPPCASTLILALLCAIARAAEIDEAERNAAFIGYKEKGVGERQAGQAAGPCQHFGPEVPSTSCRYKASLQTLCDVDSIRPGQQHARMQTLLRRQALLSASPLSLTSHHRSASSPERICAPRSWRSWLRSRRRGRARAVGSIDMSQCQT